MLRGGGSVLAVHPGALGDVILFGHLLQAVDADVMLVAGGEKARLLAGLGIARRALDFDALPMHEVFVIPPRPMEQYLLPGLLGRHGRLVSCFAAGNAQAEAALTEMCGAQSAYFLPVRPPNNFPGHLVDLWVELMGLPVLMRKAPPWPVPPEWRRAAARVLTEAGVNPSEQYVVLHPGAGAEAKCWPVERFIDLAGLLGGKNGLTVVSILGPAEQERWKAEQVKALAGASVLLPPMDLPTLTGVLGGAGGFVGNDSGPAHLASAVGTATVVITSSVSVRHFTPLGRRVEAVEAGEVEDISPRTVERSLAGLLGGR